MKACKKNPKNMKACPVCGKNFYSSGYNPKSTCSHSCSNTHFRTGLDSPNWKYEGYRSTCFEFHEKKCIVCDELNIVEVHHVDKDCTRTLIRLTETDLIMPVNKVYM